ncbi:MAG: EamA family transporter [Eggerthellaceae bacterium]|nr:EamA family transporter [Eggerthellaceae bacterium]
MGRDYAKYLTSLLIFGSNGIWVKAIALPTHEIALVRVLLGALSLLIVFLATRKRFSLHLSRKNFLFVAASGACLGLSVIFLFQAYHEVGVAVSSLLYALGPVGLMVVSPIVFKTRLTRSMVAGFAVIVAGVVLVNGAVDTTLNITGILCGLAAAASYTVMIVLGKFATVEDGLERTVVQLLCATVTIAVIILATGMPLQVPAATDILPMLVLGIGNMGLGCYLYFSSVANLPTSTVATCSYIEYLSAVLFSAVFLHELLSAGQWVGAVLIIGGALFCEVIASRQREAS